MKCYFLWFIINSSVETQLTLLKLVYGTVAYLWIMNHVTIAVSILVYTNTIMNFFWLTITSGISIKKISSTSGVAHSPFPLKMILLSESTNAFHRVAKNLQCVGNVNTSFEVFFIYTLFLQLDSLLLRAVYITFSYF